ncbi:hypothetical protein C8Q75DRAFT_425326 [Abortiporus biennis]|nr:hypothetical protein C8Q75DRAFT_425326 [Abortiporus biennis]
MIERNHIVAGVQGQAPILKGMLYGNVDVSNSVWQLEPRASRLSTRERTTSTVSTTSTQSSFAVVTDPEISSSFAASLAAGLASDPEEAGSSSPALSSPISLSVDDQPPPLQTGHRRQNQFTISHPVSPQSNTQSLSLASSFSSLESLHSASGRLLTLHLEKAESVIWPSLIIGPVPESLSPSNTAVYPWLFDPSSNTESLYNMDPTSLVLIALDLCDIRHSKEEAFEYFVRAWHQAHVPAATIRLSTGYLPVTVILPDLPSDVPVSSSSSTSTPSASPCVTPTLPRTIPSYTSEPSPGSPAYYVEKIGGASSLAVLYLEAGLLYLEGTASNLLSSQYNGLSSLRTTSTQGHSHPDNNNGTEVWRRDREIARRYFERSRSLDPTLDIPLLPPTPDTEGNSEPESLGHRRTGSGEVESGEDENNRSQQQQQRVSQQQQPRLKLPSVEVPHEKERVRKRRKKDEHVGLNQSSASLVNDRHISNEEDNTWYLYLPGLVGAGTALLVVGFLSFSSWRKGQGS